MKRVRFVLGCRRPHLDDRGGDNVILGIVAIGCIVVVGLALYYQRASEASAFVAVLMAIVNAIKEGRQQRSSERTIQQVAPTSSPTP